MRVAEDVNLETVAERLKGFSGADMTNVCREAAMMGMRRLTANLSPQEIKLIPQEEILDIPITADDFEQAIAHTSPSVSSEDIHKYTKWMDEYGAC